MKKKIIVIVGPTASGKTALGVRIAEKFGGEVISADSMQIYKGMDVATAKPTEKEMCGIPHHLIGFVEPSEKYSVSSFCEDAARVVGDVISRGKIPVMVGGTGLYIDSFINNTSFLDNASSDDVRAELEAELSERGIDALHAELEAVDPESAALIHKNNKIRVLRALEVYRCTGLTITQQKERSHDVPSEYDPLFIGISFKDRQKLYERINMRVDRMLEDGLLEEARAFFSRENSATSVNAIGYKELKPFIDGVLPFDECIETLKRETRKYAKRQLTWFKRNERIHWLYFDEYSEAEEFFSAADEIVKNYFGR